MQLKWEGESGYLSAHTPFGSYTVTKTPHTGWTWNYCFSEYYDEDSVSAEDEESAKAAANEHWQERIAPIVAPYLDVKEAARTLAMVENIDQIAQACAEYGVATPKVVAILRALEAQEGGE